MENHSHDSEIYSGFSVSLQSAPLIKRACATFIDYGIITAAAYILGMLAFFIGITFFSGLAAASDGNDTVIAGIGIVALIVIIVVSILIMLSFSWYFIKQELQSGTTIGKKIMGLRVISLSGDSLTFSQALVRDLMRYIDIFMFFPGLISCVSSARGQRLGDMMANTLVVYSDSSYTSETYLFVTQEDYWLFHDTLQPLSIEKSVANDYLKYAYRDLLKSASPIPDSHWIGIAHQHIQNPNDQEVEDLSLLKFFAEYCRRIDIPV